MKIVKLDLICMTIIISIFTCTGCWNYRETEQIAIVAGLAVDYHEDSKQYSVTFETVDIHISGKETDLGTKLITSYGETIFDAVRNAIMISSKKLYFGHAKVVIISDNIANQGCASVLDWITRDGETRNDITVLITKQEASSIFIEGKKVTDEVLSYDLYELMQTQESLSKAPKIQLWELINAISAKDISATVPEIRLIKNNEEIAPEVSGAGIFRKDHLIGFLDGEDVKFMLMIKDEIKGGILVVHTGQSEKDMVSLEIFGCKTNIRPEYTNNQIIMHIQTEMDVAIAENMGNTDFGNKENRKKLTSSSEKAFEERIRNLVKKVQVEYGADIFGFGKEIRIHKPQLWKAIEDQWESVFELVEIDVDVKVMIRNSGFLRMPIDKGL